MEEYVANLDNNLQMLVKNKEVKPSVYATKHNEATKLQLNLFNREKE